jgi:hypothetical protein
VIACETRRSATEPAFGFGAEAENLCGLVTGWESHSLDSGRLQAAGIAKDASPEPQHGGTGRVKEGVCVGSGLCRAAAGEDPRHVIADIWDSLRVPIVIPQPGCQKVSSQIPLG